MHVLFGEFNETFIWNRALVPDVDNYQSKVVTQSITKTCSLKIIGDKYSIVETKISNFLKSIHTSPPPPNDYRSEKRKGGERDMAVATRTNSRLKLEFEDGLDVESGNVILKRKTFNNVKTASTTEELLAVTKALVPLQQRELYSIKRDDTELITEE